MPLEFDSFRYRPSEIRTVFTFKCSAPGCDSKVEQVQLGSFQDVPHWPSDGWFPYGEGCYLCPKHIVMTWLDGRPFTIHDKDGVRELGADILEDVYKQLIKNAAKPKD